MKTLEERVEALEKRVKKMLDSFNKLKHSRGMTVREFASKGGSARVLKGPASLSPERRHEIAKAAAAARWNKGAK
jgi:hypothetical protein